MTTVIKRNKWEIWRDVIFALFAREIRTGFNDKFGLSWAVLNPVAFIFILSFIRGRLDGGESHTIPTFVFMAYGLLLIQLFLEMLGSSGSAMRKAKALYAFKQVQPISAVLAKALFEILVKFFVILGIAIIMYFLNIELQIANPLLLMSCFILLAILSITLGMLFGIAEMFIPEISKIRGLLTRPLFFISGVFFSLQDFPKEYWHYLDWNPILHAIELSRYAAYPSYGDAGVNLSYLGACTLVITFLSFSLYYSAWRQAISR